MYKQKLKTKMWKAEQVVICPQPSVLVLLDPGQERAILSQMTTFSTGCSEKGDFEKCNLTSQWNYPINVITDTEPAGMCSTE